MKYIREIAAALLLALLFTGCGGKSAAQAGSSVNTAQSANDAAALAADIPTTQRFTEEAVAEADVEKIVTAGVNAPSAMNGQPWHFSVITDPAVLRQISDGMKGGARPSGGPPQGGDLPEGFKPPDGASPPEGFTPPEGMEKLDRPEPPAGMPDAPGGGKTPPAAPPSGGPSAGGAKAGLTDAPLAIVVSCRKGSELDAGLACQTMSVEAQLLGYGTKIVSSPTIALNGERQGEFRELLGIPEDQSAAAVLLIGREAAVEAGVDGTTGATERSPLAEKVTFIKP